MDKLEIAPLTTIPAMEEWNTILSLAGVLVKSGFLPSTIKTAEAGAAIILKGRELGIPPMQAFAHISVIQAKPTCSAELQLALLVRGGVTWKIIQDGTTGTAEIEFRRPGFGNFVSRFGLEDAKRAGLSGNQSWTKYPAAMCRARAISAGARVIGPDLLAGMSYTPEELGATVNMDDDGNIAPVVTPVPPPTTPVPGPEHAQETPKPLNPASNPTPTGPDAPIGDNRASKLETAIMATGCNIYNLMAAIPKYCGGKKTLASLTEAEGKKLLTHFQKKAAQKKCVGGDSDDQAVKIAQDLEADISNGVDVTDSIDAMFRHSAFDAAREEFETAIKTAQDQAGQIGVARKMRDMLVGNQEATT